MQYHRVITLKDGSSCILRNGTAEDGRNPKGFRSRFSGWQELVLMRLDLDRQAAKQDSIGV